MSIQAYDADMVETPGAEALASGAVASLWASFGGVWPLWSILTVINALGAATTSIQTQAGLAPQDWGEKFGTLFGSSIGASLVSGIAIRLMLGRGKAAWLPDRGLLGYTMTVTLFSVAPSLTVLMLQAPQGHSQAALGSFAMLAFGAVVASLVILWATLRLTLWPIGRLLGNQDVTPGRSWKLMRGAVMRYVMAVILLGAPLLMLNFMVVLLTKPQGRLISQIAASPLSALMALMAAAVAAEVYRARVVVAPTED